MGKLGPKSKFTDVACQNEALEYKEERGIGVRINQHCKQELPIQSGH
jgi:hypothetical protein